MAASSPATRRDRAGPCVRGWSCVHPAIVAAALDLWFGGAVAAQTAAAPEAQLLETGDGSRFLLVKTDQRVAHWINLQPADSRVEPAGLQGLALAVARASLAGSARPDPVPTTPLDWEKALRQVPSSGSQLVEVPGHLGVAVGFPVSGLVQVARLLRLRARRTALSGVRIHLDAARERRRAMLQAMPHLGLLRRLVDQCPAARPYASALDDHSSAPVADATIMEFYRRTYAPERGINVLTGDFDLVAVTAVLRSTFKQPAPREDRAVAAHGPPVNAPPTARDAGDTLLLGCPLPATVDPAPGDPATVDPATVDPTTVDPTTVDPTTVDPATVVGIDLLVEYLAGDPDAFLPDHLRAAGHPAIEVHARAPFPALGGILLLTVTDKGRPIAAGSPLVAELRRALGQVVAAPPEPARLARATAALRAARSAALRQPEGLALLLARRWARTGIPPRTDLAAENRISATGFRALASRILAVESQILVLPAPAPGGGRQAGGRR